MSYCRFGWNGSDVYVYMGQGGIVCCACQLQDDGDDWPAAMTPAAAAVHLYEHRDKGHTVPHYAIDELMLEAGDTWLHPAWLLGYKLRVLKLAWWRWLHARTKRHTWVTSLQCDSYRHMDCVCAASATEWQPGHKDHKPGQDNVVVLWEPGQSDQGGAE